MNRLFAKQTVSVSELKKSPSKVIKSSGNEPTVILNHNEPSAYLVPPKLFEKMMDALEDFMLNREVQARIDEDNEKVKVDISDL
ncbi:MAG: type II toxin-antitoxin system prevent-host-death family antitoxin [candidate division WOR-3 bacterium]|nr:type II toxin-antitoxin system prevent-host-death family antitoxin [candidate division WOR-3 bacterium]